MNGTTANSELLDNAIAYEAMLFLEQAKTPVQSVSVPNQLRYCIANRYARVFFDVMTQKIKQEVEENPAIGDCIIRQYTETHPDLLNAAIVTPAGNYAEPAQALPFSHFSKLKDPVLRAGIDAKAHIEADLIDKLNRYTPQEHGRLLNERNFLAQQSHDAHDIIHGVKQYVPLGWAQEKIRLQDRFPSSPKAEATCVIFQAGNDVTLHTKLKLWRDAIACSGDTFSEEVRGKREQDSPDTTPPR